METHPRERDGLREVKELVSPRQGWGGNLSMAVFPRDNPEPLVLLGAAAGYSQPSEGY